MAGTSFWWRLALALCGLAPVHWHMPPPPTPPTYTHPPPHTTHEFPPLHTPVAAALQRLIVVANRLPVSAYKDRGGRWQLQVGRGGSLAPGGACWEG
jgi:hypothetical protein